MMLDDDDLYCVNVRRPVVNTVWKSFDETAANARPYLLKEFRITGNHPFSFVQLVKKLGTKTVTLFFIKDSRLDYFAFCQRMIANDHSPIAFRASRITSSCE